MEVAHLQRVRLLYKTIIKLHRGLPEELRVLGNGYMRDEFKRHKKCTPAETAVFMIEWTRYAMSLAEQLGIRGPQTAAKIGTPLPEEHLEHMSDEQIQQLYELMLAAQGQENEDIVEDTLNRNKTQ